MKQNSLPTYPIYVFMLRQSNTFFLLGLTMMSIEISFKLFQMMPLSLYEAEFNNHLQIKSIFFFKFERHNPPGKCS